MLRLALLVLTSSLLASALSSCGPMSVGGDLCRRVEPAAASRALGLPLTRATPEPGKGAAVAACSWIAEDPDRSRPRLMKATLWRVDRAHSSEGVFADELQQLEADFGRTRVIDGVGDAAVLGVGEADDAGYAGGLVVRRDRDILVMRLDGGDPAEFEQVARTIVGKI